MCFLNHITICITSFPLCTSQGIILYVVGKLGAQSRGPGKKCFACIVILAAAKQKPEAWSWGSSSDFCSDPFKDSCRMKQQQHLCAGDGECRPIPFASPHYTQVTRSLQLRVSMTHPYNRPRSAYQVVFLREKICCGSSLSLFHKTMELRSCVDTARTSHISGE